MGYLLPPQLKTSFKLPSIHSLLLNLPVEFNKGEVATAIQLISPAASPDATIKEKSGEDNELSKLAAVASSIPLARNRSLSDPTNHKLSPSLTTVTEDVSTNPNVEYEKLSQETPDDSLKSAWKPRKKRQCPECKLYFSNLATHKSTHLKPTSRPHICKYCNRGFARPNDLFRHVKCHWKEIGSDKGQFKCPFKHHSTGDHCCHSSGIFSRCDTFKNHLKAIHFQYPNGTKKDQRNKVSGTCRTCHQEFSTVDDWLNNHIEKNLCPYASSHKRI